MLWVHCGGAATTSAETMAEASTSYAFLSYSRKDQAFAAHLARDLREHGIHLWFDQLDIAPGDDWDEAVQRALHGARAVVFIVSADSVVSDNVLNELTVALDAKKWVIPVMIAAVTVPLRIARMQRIDFVSDYPAALAHLVAHMQGGGSRTSALSAIAASQLESGETHSPSLEPVQRSAPAASRRSSWLLPAVIGAGVTFCGIVGLVIVLAVIGTSEESSTPDAEVADPSVESARPNLSGELIEGHWLGACLQQDSGKFLQMSLNITRSHYAAEATFHDAADCERPLFAITFLYDIVSLAPVKPGLYAADYRVQNVSIVPIESAELLNRRGTLGIHQWRDGAPMELPTPTVTAMFGAPLRPGTMIYDLVAVEGEVLRRGASSEGKLAFVPADRPTELESVTYARQPP